MCFDGWNVDRQTRLPLSSKKHGSVFLEGPAQVLYDHGGEFTKDFEALLEQVGTQATIIPVESHWRGGLVERHGATAKTIMRKLIDQDSVYEDTAFRWQETAASNNSLSRRNGFSPVQWVFGYGSCFPGSALDRPQDLAAHDHIQAGGQLAAKW